MKVLPRLQTEPPGIPGDVTDNVSENLEEAAEELERQRTIRQEEDGSVTIDLRNLEPQDQPTPENPEEPTGD